MAMSLVPSALPLDSPAGLLDAPLQGVVLAHWLRPAPTASSPASAAASDRNQVWMPMDSVCCGSRPVDYCILGAPAVYTTGLCSRRCMRKSLKDPLNETAVRSTSGCCSSSSRSSCSVSPGRCLMSELSSGSNTKPRGLI